MGLLVVELMMVAGWGLGCGGGGAPGALALLTGATWPGVTCWVEMRALTLLTGVTRHGVTSCVEMLGLPRGLGVPIPGPRLGYHESHLVAPNPGPGLGHHGRHLRGVAFGELFHLGTDGHQGSDQGLQHMLHFHDGTVIWTHELQISMGLRWLIWGSGGGWGVLLVLCPNFLGEE